MFKRTWIFTYDGGEEEEEIQALYQFMMKYYTSDELIKAIKDINADPKVFRRLNQMATYISSQLSPKK